MMFSHLYLVSQTLCLPHIHCSLMATQSHAPVFMVALGYTTMMNGIIEVPTKYQGLGEAVGTAEPSDFREPPE